VPTPYQSGLFPGAADAVLLTTSLRSLYDPSDINCNMCGKLVCEYLREEEKLPAF
jgi:hypothetical protein